MNIKFYLKNYLTLFLLGLVVAAILMTHRPAVFPESGVVEIRAQIVGRPAERTLAKLLPSHKTIWLYLPKNYDFKQLDYADELVLRGQFKLPKQARNPGQFDERNYLQNRQISGKFYVTDVAAVLPHFGNPITRLAFWLHAKINVFNQATIPAPYCNLYTSLVFGQSGAKLPQEMSEEFQKVGLSHLLVASGAQVSLLMTTVWVICDYFALSAWVIVPALGVVSVLFYAMTGGGESIFRACVMSGIAMSLKLMRRKTSAVHVLSLTALIMLLINPACLFDIGAQLSFAATGALLYGARPIQRVFESYFPVWIATLLGLTFAPFLWTAPILMATKGSVSLTSLPANFLVIGWVESLVVMGFASGCVGLVVPALAGVINQAAWLLLVALVKITTYLSDLGGNVVLVHPPFWLVLVWYAGIFALTFGLIRRRPRWILCALMLIVLTTAGWKSKPFFISEPLEMTFLDVGQGDGIVVKTPNQTCVLIDTGPVLKNFKTGQVYFDAGRNVIDPFLRYEGISQIDLVVSSHQHLDHIGGLPWLKEHFKIGQELDNRRFKNNSVITLSDGVKLTLLHPLQNKDTHNENDRSIIAKISYKDIDILLTGDLEEEGEEALLRKFAYLLPCEVLKVGHHGSRTSSSPEFVARVNPRVAVVSVGIQNKFHHPNPDVMARLKSRGIRVLRTDQSGAITLRTDGHRVEWESFLTL